MEVCIGRYKLSFDESTVKYEEYESPGSFYGIIFHDGDWTYDIICNRYMGERLFITGARNSPFEFHWRDIPFHQGTIGFLPETIVVTPMYNAAGLAV